MSQTTAKTIYGVIGAGSFGTALANILAENGQVLLYARKQATIDSIHLTGQNRNQKIHSNITLTNVLQEVCEKSRLIFPVVPSANFRDMMRVAAPFLQPDHILIHGTKGLNVDLPDGQILKAGEAIDKSHIKTMSNIIREESLVLRMGCLSGPNLATEIAQGQPAATVVASRFEEVVSLGKTALKTDRFRVYGSSEIIGVELAGVFKNMIAIASGIMHGLGWGKNAKAMLITRGLREMIMLGKALGTDISAFFGLAGIGDLIATCLSELSRNFRVGLALTKGDKREHILANIGEVAEGVTTVKIAKGIAAFYNIECPIVEALYQVLYCQQSVEKSINYLMQHKFDADADFLT